MSYNVSDVMASRNDITTYANKKSMIFLSSATQNTIETKKIISLALLQTEIGTACLMTS